MRTSLICILAFFFISISQAQEKELITLKEAVNLAWQNSHQGKITHENVVQATQRLQMAKNKQYPDFTLSGQLLYLAKPDLDIQLNLPSNNSGNSGTSKGEMPEPHYLFLGQANASLPIFTGLKIKNAVKASKNEYNAALYTAKSNKANLALKAIEGYVNLYKARKTVALIQENLKHAQQRVSDFTAMEKNGLLPLNDLLKAKLQEADIKLTLAKAQKNTRIINYRLSVFLQLPTPTKIEIDSLSFGLLRTEASPTQISRPDVKALQYRVKAAQNNIDIKKGNYYPSLALTAGLLTADIENTLTVKQAFNIGIGLSYNLSSIFKNKSAVRLAKSKAHQLDLKLKEVQDQASIAIENARENYKLALQNYSVYKKSVAQAQENYRIVKDKFNNGLMDTKDLLEADVQQLQSKINLANGKAEITLKYYELKQAQGKLINEFANN